MGRRGTGTYRDQGGRHTVECAVDAILEGAETDIQTGTVQVIVAERGCLVVPIGGSTLEAAGACFGELVRHVASRWNRLHVRLLVEDPSPARSRRRSHLEFTSPRDLRRWLGTEAAANAQDDAWQIHIGK